MARSEVRWEASMPATYDRLLGPVILSPFADLLAAEAAKSGGPEVLELAAGTGILTRRLAATLPDADLRATDLNPAMAEYGKRQAPDARWQVADVRELPFPDRAFDLVTRGFGVMLFDRATAFPEVRRVISDGGTSCLPPGTGSRPTRRRTCSQTASPRYCPTTRRTSSPASPTATSTPGTIRAGLEDAGFSGVELRLETIPSRAPSARSSDEGLCLGSPLRFGLEERGDLTELTGVIATDMETSLGTGPVEGAIAAPVIRAGR